MTKELWNDLNLITDYLYENEEKDYESYEEKPDNHIFLSVKRLNKFLLANPNK